MASLRIAACQINTRVGALEHNVGLVLDALDRATEAGCDLAVFPEHAITGSPAGDLLLKPGFLADARNALETVAARTGACVAVVGFPGADPRAHSAMAICADGAVQAVHRRTVLVDGGPNEDHRHLDAGTAVTRLATVAGVPLGIAIGADVDDPSGVVLQQGRGGAEVILVPSADPYAEGATARRERLLAARAVDAGAAVVRVGQVGAQDDLVFDGGSSVHGPEGELIARSPQFEEDLLIVDLDVDEIRRIRDLDRRLPTGPALPILPIGTGGPTRERADRRPAAPVVTPLLDADAELYRALVVGTRDYLDKNGFGGVVIGLSGGVDSTLVAAIAVDAIGPERVHGVLMPSRYSSDHSVTDAEALADNLGIERRTIAIEAGHRAMLEMLAPSFAGRDPGVTEENIQSRLRGLVLMSLSNEFGWIVLSTGNKSETAVGYTTLYGDTVGGYAVLRDVYKSRVYDLCRWRNAVADRPVIPENVIVKPPSAELRPDQRDDQNLPPYEILDPLLTAYIEEDRTAAELIGLGHDAVLVGRVTRLVDAAEYKRRQSPVGPRVTRKAFGTDRRLPITNGYR